MPNSINSLSPDFRDFLLNRNLITDTVTNNGLETLLAGIGLPITDIGTYPEAVQPSNDIVTYGGFYKDLNLITNKFQGNENDYQLVNINYTSNNPPTSAFIYSSNYAADTGILNDTLNAPANGPFQGGDIREFNTAKNLYFDPTKQTLVSLDSFGAPNVQYTNYQEINNGIVNNAIDVLGSVLTGGGLGIGSNSNGTTLVPDFDLRSTLLGRVLGGTGVIADTPLGQAGAKYLALALANNAAFGLQQETIGHLNLNPLNIAMNGVDSILIPNYSITVPKSTLGRVLDFGARVLGFESPISLYSRDSSIFNSENPISNIDRANAQIINTGKGQVLSLFANLKANKDFTLINRRNGYTPGFVDGRTADKDQDGGGVGINADMYAFGTSDGKVIDFLNNNLSVDFNGDKSIIEGDGEYDVNSPISQSNYRLSELVDNSGFGESLNGESQYGEDGSYVTQYIWGDDRPANLPGKRIFGDSTKFNNKKTLLGKTKGLFASNKMRTIVSGKADVSNEDEIQSAVHGGTISKGSGVLSERALSGDFSVPEDVYCRVWTTFDRYNQVQDLQKSSGINGNTAYRKGYNDGDSVLGDNGFVKIGPYVGDSTKDSGGETNIKNFMFSLENLAWADNQESLTDCEKGPGDLMTGKKGRIMWFPPYDLSVTENVSVSWESTNFIGRGEPIYTYSNTERTGTLQFKIVVDHPSYLNAIRSETDDYIASFFAGCTDIDPILAEKLTAVERSQIETERDGPPIVPKAPDVQTPDITKFSVYLPNDVSIPFLYPTYEDKFSEELGSGVGTTEDSGTVSIVKATSTDRNNFGLNGDKNEGLTVEGGWITEAGKNRLRNALNVQCPACTISVKGYASYQGQTLNPNGNKKIRINRAKELRKWIEENILNSDPNIISGKITFDDRFKPYNDSSILGDVTGCKDIKQGINDDFCLKVARKAVAEFTFDGALALKLTNNEKDPVVAPKEKWRVSKKITNRFYNECNYFEKLRQEDAVVYSSLKEKLRFFHPAFHAITPEGLNSRLTFLQQCTRQGPTNVGSGPDNLAFGRPPICILRLGDFYYTKIAIDNIGISYEPLVWDLNPEGIGVQPMIATVDLSFKMIGGQSMKGPINKLQNAVTFNFFGNTQIYDERADKIAKTADAPNGAGLPSLDDKYRLVPGITVMENTVETTEEQYKTGIDGNGDETIEIIQTRITTESQSQSSDGDILREVLTGSFIKFKSEANYYYDFIEEPKPIRNPNELTFKSIWLNAKPDKEQLLKNLSKTKFGAKVKLVTDTGNIDIFKFDICLGIWDENTTDELVGLISCNELAGFSNDAGTTTGNMLDVVKKYAFSKAGYSQVLRFFVVLDDYPDIMLWNQSYNNSNYYMIDFRCTLPIEGLATDYYPDDLARGDDYIKMVTNPCSACGGPYPIISSITEINGKC